MYELTGSIADLTIDYVTNTPKITLAINENKDIVSAYDELKSKEKLSIIIKPYKKKRSLDANAYFWALLGKLAEKLHQNKLSLYRELIRNIGNNFEILPIRNDAVKTFTTNWGAGKLGWVCDIIGESKIDGYTNVCAYYGSSTYDTKQMSDLIDLVVMECQEQCIQTMTPDELAKLKALWGNNG